MNILISLSFIHGIIEILFNFQTCTAPAPLSTDKQAQDERDRVDYTLKMTKELAEDGKGKI